MVTREARTLSRDVEVAAIPYGDCLTLTAGTTVFITQALGGSYTAMTDHGYLVRIEGKDADAIGETPTKPLTTEEVGGRTTEQIAWDQLKTCFDPEIPSRSLISAIVRLAPAPARASWSRHRSPYSSCELSFMATSAPAAGAPRPTSWSGPTAGRARLGRPPRGPLGSPGASAACPA